MVKRQRIELIAGLCIVLALLVAVLVIWRGPLLAFFGDRERMADFVRRQGRWAPLVTVSLHIMQVVIAPIPGQVLDAVNGYLFGPLLGTLYSMIGVMGGSFLAMGLTRCFGRPLAERLVGAHALNRIDRYARRRGPLFFLVFFLMPFVPDDVTCFLAGLTPIPLVELMLIALVGRLPGIAVANLVGSAVTELTLPQMVIFGVACLLLALVFWWGQERIEESLIRVIAGLTGKH
ncbi:MAG: TVP38/TMEM64 family protein [Anaerolineae bacterium]|nr:TVP38/TMEM64 family protein [Anaerolineae bacterium]